MESAGMKITVLGVLVIAGVVASLILLVQFVRSRSPENRDHLPQ